MQTTNPGARPLAFSIGTDITMMVFGLMMGLLESNTLGNCRITHGLLILFTVLTSAVLWNINILSVQDADCLAVWSLIVPYDDDEINPDSTFLKRKGLLWQEREDCDTSFPYLDNMYICRECHYTEFDEPWYIKLCEGTLKRKICGKDNEMLHIPSYEAAKRQRVCEGNIMVNEEIIPVSEWLQHLKEKWDIHS